MSRSNCSTNSLPCSPTCEDQCDERQYKRYPEQNIVGRYDPGISYFTSMLIPVTNLTPGSSTSNGCVEFMMRRKNKTVTLQWEPFSGTLGSNGIQYLTVTQSICNTPPYPIPYIIPIQYKGIDRMVKIVIDPHTKNGNIFYYLNSDGSSNNTNMGDTFYVYAGSVTWIVV